MRESLTERFWRPATKPNVCENGLQVLKLKFYAAILITLSYPLHKPYIAWPWQHENTFIQAFRSVPGCQTCTCKRGINFVFNKSIISNLRKMASSFIVLCQSLQHSKSAPGHLHSIDRQHSTTLKWICSHAAVL